jgi:hypothetical protein
MLGLLDLFWTCVIAGSIMTIGYQLRSELKNGQIKQQ